MILENSFLLLFLFWRQIMLVCRESLDEGKQVYILTNTDFPDKPSQYIFEGASCFISDNSISFGLNIYIDGRPIYDKKEIPNNGFSQSTIRAIKYAFKILMTYKTLNGKKNYEFDERETEELIRFTAGIDFIGKGIEYSFAIKRNLSTVKDYFSKYITYGNIITPYNKDANNTSEIYKIIEKVYSTKPRDYINVSKDYITPNEYKKLSAYINDSGNPCYRIILKLLYEYGLRIREILGLTKKDIVKRERRPSYLDIFHKGSTLQKEEAKDNYKYEIIINKKDLSFGLDIVYINEELYNEIRDYIEYLTNRIEDGNYRKHIFSEHKDKNEESSNFYLMLDLTAKNQKLRLLSINTWNKFLEEAFDNCLINYDYRMRNTLSKVVRNGYGRYHAIFSDPPKEPEELCEMMRYTKVSSVLKYYTEIKEEEKVIYEFETQDAERRISKFIFDNRIDVSRISNSQMKALEKIDKSIQNRLNRVLELKNKIKKCDVTIATISEDTAMSKQTFYNNSIYKEYIDLYKQEYEKIKDE